jgi:hypothetical protein
MVKLDHPYGGPNFNLPNIEIQVMATLVLNFLLTAGTALDKLLHEYNSPAYCSPSSRMTF